MNKRLKFALEQIKKHPRKPFIHPSVNIPDWVKIGKNVTIHENCTIGTEGFGFAKNEDGTWLHIPQSGTVIIGDNVEIYAGTNIDRGTIDATIIGEGTKIDHHCHIGHNVQIGKNCLITAKTIIAGSTKIGDNAWIGIGTTIVEHITIGKNVFIGAHSNVLKSVKNDSKVYGNPAKEL